MTSLVPPSQAGIAAAGIVVSAAVAFAYLYVGFRLADRVVSPSARLASLQLALWWGGLGATVALGGVEIAFALSNALPLALAITLGLVVDLVDCAFLWGLTGFLVYVYTGKYHLLEVSALYAFLFVAAVYYEFSQIPTGVVFRDGAAALTYALAPAPWLAAIIIVVLIGPVLTGAVLYLSLVRRTRVREQRVRIYLVGGGILLWFGLDIIFPSSTPAWALAHAAVEVLPALMSLIAFYPPARAQRRWGLTVVPSRRDQFREGRIDG
jgi:hypothetical protein